MGYYTDFDLSSNSDEVVEALQKQSEYSYFRGIKWYEHEDDCKKVSLLFPDTVIEVSGEGEESGDVWKAYYKNGKSFRAEAVVTFEPFNESKLK